MWGGKLGAMPIYTNNAGLIYNKGRLQQAGLRFPPWDGSGQGQYIACYLLQEDPRLVPPDNCKEWILRWCTISYIKPCSHVERN